MGRARKCGKEKRYSDRLKKLIETCPVRSQMVAPNTTTTIGVDIPYELWIGQAGPLMVVWEHREMLLPPTNPVTETKPLQKPTSEEECVQR